MHVSTQTRKMNTSRPATVNTTSATRAVLLLPTPPVGETASQGDGAVAGWTVSLLYENIGVVALLYVRTYVRPWVQVP